MKNIINKEVDSIKKDIGLMTKEDIIRNIILVMCSIKYNKATKNININEFDKMNIEIWNLINKK